MVDANAQPVTHHTPIPIPFHWQSDVTAGLDHGVIGCPNEPVLVGEPVTWCHHLVICAKKNGKPRQTVDFQALNLHATQETHHTQSPFHQARSVPGGTKKTVFNCWNGYHSVLLHPDDHHLTTFIRVSVRVMAAQVHRISQFLKDWGGHLHLSSVAHSHSNCRAEIGVKTVKRLITNNTDPHALQRAILPISEHP